MKATRRADPHNPNRVVTVGFGFGSEKGTKDQAIEHRSKSQFG